jgi:threonine synthase
MKNLYLECVKCGGKYSANGKILTCPNHNPKYSYLEVIYDYQKIKNFPNFKSKGWGKYLSLLPINNFQINLNEISTEATRLKNLGTKLGLSNLYLKDETKNATGSFKDKESIISINKALELKIKKVFTISSGNGALSASAYAKKAELDCTCFVPTSTSKPKLQMIKQFGGKITKLLGSYEDVYNKIIRKNPKAWNITSGYNPFGNEGDKITAFEIWESIGVPDYIIVPCGNGGNLYGIWKGFEELKILDLIKKVPKMIGVQIEGAAPLKKALEQNKEFVVLQSTKDSIAEGIVASESYTSPKTIKALRLSKGSIITVNDKEIEIAIKLVGQTEILLPEITAASAFAALPKLNCSKNAKVVVIMTGTGMKYLSYSHKFTKSHSFRFSWFLTALKAYARLNCA